MTHTPRPSRHGRRLPLRRRNAGPLTLTRAEPLESRRLLAATGPIISEFMASNQSTLADEDGEFSDWIEVHNPTESAVNLNGWALRDGGATWNFPAMTLDAGGYLLVFASDKNRRDPAGRLHTNFKLTADGEYLGLIRPDNT